jgi:hypothetical protein
MLGVVKGSLKLSLVNQHRHYGGYGGALCGTRIRYTRLLVYLVGNDLVSVVEGEDSSGHRFPGVVDLVQSISVIGLVLEDPDQFKGLMVTTSALGRCSVGIHAQRRPNYHQQR